MTASSPPHGPSHNPLKTLSPLPIPTAVLWTRQKDEQHLTITWDRNPFVGALQSHSVLDILERSVLSLSLIGMTTGIESMQSGTEGVMVSSGLKPEESNLYITLTTLEESEQS